MIVYKGTPVPVLTAGMLMPAEVDDVESLLGKTFPKIQRELETCVCGHGARAHSGEAGGIRVGVPCRMACDCEGFMPDVPMRLSLAFAWVAIRRALPDVTFDDLLHVEGADLQLEADEPAEQAEDPTEGESSEESPNDAPDTSL